MDRCKARRNHDRIFPRELYREAGHDRAQTITERCWPAHFLPDRGHSSDDHHLQFRAFDAAHVAVESDAQPSPERVSTPVGSGFYILHEDFPDNAAALAIPHPKPGILAPYQERAKQWPLQFVLHFDRQQDRNTIFSLLMVFGNTEHSAAREALARSLAALDVSTVTFCQENSNYYRKFLSEHKSIDTPDASLNAAFASAELAIDQLRVNSASSSAEEAFTAGFVDSGDSAHPGFRWFLGRDTLWSL